MPLMYIVRVNSSTLTPLLAVFLAWCAHYFLLGYIYRNDTTASLSTAPCSCCPVSERPPASLPPIAESTFSI